jgi:hypothetical protein
MIKVDGYEAIGGRLIIRPGRARYFLPGVGAVVRELWPPFQVGEPRSPTDCFEREGNPIE